MITSTKIVSSSGNTKITAELNSFFADVGKI